MGLVGCSTIDKCEDIRLAGLAKELAQLVMT